MTDHELDTRGDCITHHPVILEAEGYTIDPHRAASPGLEGCGGLWTEPHRVIVSMTRHAAPWSTIHSTYYRHHREHLPTEKRATS